MRLHLQRLIRMLETVCRKVLYNDIENEIGKISDVDWLLEGNASNFERHRLKFCLTVVLLSYSNRPPTPPTSRRTIAASRTRSIPP